MMHRSIAQHRSPNTTIATNKGSRYTIRMYQQARSQWQRVKTSAGHLLWHPNSKPRQNTQMRQAKKWAVTINALARIGMQAQTHNCAHM